MHRLIGVFLLGVSTVLAGMAVFGAMSLTGIGVVILIGSCILGVIFVK